MTANFRDLIPVLQGPLDALAQVELIKHLNQTTWLLIYNVFVIDQCGSGP